MDFGKQVGKQNGPKIDPKRHWKKDAKKKRFCEVWVGVNPRAGVGGRWRRGPSRTPLTQRRTPKDQARARVFGVYKVQVQGPLDNGV